MKPFLLYSTYALLIAAYALGLAACDGNGVALAPTDLKIAPPESAGADPSTSAVYRLGNPPQVIDGAYSELVRDAQGVTVRFSTHGLERGRLYSLWIIVYTNPETCTGATIGGARCGASDSASASHLCGYATATDHAAFVCRPGSATAPLPYDALTGAEIHVVLRAHGPLPDGEIAQALGTPETDCWSDQCADTQRAVHALS